MAFLHSPPTSEDEFPVDIAAWLSDVASDFSSHNTPTNPACKRKRSHSANESPARSKLPRSLYSVAGRAALAGVALDSVPRSRSVPVNLEKFTAVSPANIPPSPRTPDQSLKTRLRSPRKTDTPRTSSSSTATKKSAPSQTENLFNVRKSLGQNGLWYEHFESYDKYPKFQEKIEKLVFRERGSVMGTESVGKIKKWRRANALENEITYFSALAPQILKPERTVPTLKRTFNDIVIGESRKFEEDGLHHKKDCPLTKRILPKRVEEVAGKMLGMSNPKPDFVFGIRDDMYPDSESPILSTFLEAFIGVAPGLRHAFFGIETKPAGGTIEDSDNQALRTGATLVNASRQLAKAAKAPSKGEEKGGVDDTSFAFTCSWVPHMAKLHVHWHELLENGTSRWHMNILQYYLMDDDDHIKNFRRDIYNILDWGIDIERQRMLREMIAKIAAKDPPITFADVMYFPVLLSGADAVYAYLQGDGDGRDED